MAGTPQGHPQARNSDAKHYVEYEEYVDYQLEKTRSIVKRTDILTTLTTLAVAVIGYLFAFVVFDQWIIEGGFSYAARVVLLGLLLSYVTGMLVWRVLFPLLRQVHPLYAARVIERSDPELKSNLVNFVDVKLSNAESAPMVMKSMQKRAAVELSHIDVEEAVDHRPLLRVAYALLAVVIVAAAYIVWSPKGTFASVMRALLPTAPIEVATETTISDVNPDDDTDVPARTVVTIEAEVHGKDANHAQILYTTNDHKYVDQSVEMRRIDENLHRFRGVLNGENGRGLLQSLTYRIVAGDAHTRDYVINVIQPPGARLDEVHYVFPTYMQLEEKTTSGGDIDGWEGAIVTVKATANVPVKSAMIVLSDTEDVHAKGEEITMQVTDGTKLSASWKLEFRPDGTSARFYHVQVKTEKGEVDPDPTQYTLRIRPDQRPEVAMLAPTGDLIMPANGIIPLIIQASDPDFQLRSITLKAERNGEAFSDQRLFEDQDLGQSYRGKTDFRLDPLRLTPGESILFWIEVKDNKQPTANRANTPRIKVEIGKPVTAAEAQKQLAEEKQKQQDQIASEKSAINPEDMLKQKPRDAGEEAKPDEAQTPKDRAEPGDEKAFEKRPTQKQRDQENPGDDASSDPGNKSDRRPQEPVTEEEALQRLLEKQQKEQQADQKPDDQKQPPADSEKSDNSAGEKSDRGKGSKAGPKSDQSNSKPDRNQTNDKSPSGNEKSDDKGVVEDPQGDRDIAKKQPGTDKSSADNKQKQDNKQQPPSADEKNQTGDNGPANDKKEDGSAKNGKGDKPGDPSKAADSKPKAKPKAGDQNKQQGNESGDKPNDAKKSDGDKQGNDKGAADNDKKPGDDADSSKKSDPGKDGSGKDAGKDDAEKNKPGKDGSGKEGASDKKPDPGDSEKGDTGKQEDGKKDMKDKGSDSAQDKAGSDDKPGDDQKKQAQGGAGKKDAAESDPASNSKDQSNAKGSPGKSDKSEGDQQPGDDNKGEKSNKKGDGPAKQSDDADPSGKEEPAEDDPNAKKKKATGDEQGEASGNEEADPDSTTAKNDLKKKEGSKAGAKKTSEDSDPSGKKSNQKRQQQEGTKQGSPDADKTDAAPDGKKPTEQPGELDEQPSERKEKKPGGEKEKRPGQPPDVGNQPMKGDGRKDGQKSEQPQAGEKGSSAATDEGKPGANKEGAGDKSDQSGNTDPTTDNTGQPGDKKKGPGSTTKPSDGGEGQKKDGPGDEPGKNDTGKKSSQKASQGKQGDEKGEEGDGGEKPGDNKGQAGGKEAGKKSGGKEGKSGSGESGDKPGDSQGKSSGDSSKPGQPGSGQQQTGSGIKSAPAEGKPGDGPGDGTAPDAAQPREGSSEGPSTPEDEQANLEAARKATNLVLQRLKSQLERGEVDQEMMDELGWKDKKDVEKFVKFLEKGMGPQQGDDNSPEAEARRLQFEETLRSMNLGNETQRRAGSVGKERAIEQIGAKNAPVPREYEKVWQSYTRSLSKQNDKADGKAKGQEKGKPAKAK